MRLSDQGESQSERHGRRGLGLILSLAWADLRHELVLSACLVLALSAVLSPLLILFGLKHGTIEVLRGRLIEDPRNREIRPLTSRSYEESWFDEMEARRDVAFAIPLTRKIASGVRAEVAGRGVAADVDLMPTKEGDRLLTENGSPVPGKGECVLSASAAKKLAANVGDSIIMRASRIVGTERETVETALTCAGVLSLRATGLPAIYVQLPVLDAVERFKDGQAVPEYGWAGSLPQAFPVYDGALVAVKEALSRERELELVVTTGFTRIERLEAEEAKAAAMPGGGTVYRFSTMASGIDASAVKNLGQRVPGVAGEPRPWVRPIGVEVSREGGRKVGVFSLSIDPVASAARKGKPGQRWAVALPSESGVAPGTKLRVRMAGLEFPAVAGRGHEEEKAALAPAELAGILRLSRERVVTYDDNANRFLVTRRGYSGFRLYARTIDDVDGLRMVLEEEGIEVATEAERIRDVLELDMYLTYVFWMIAGVGLAGSVAALVASLYAAVERKRRSLSVLRLIGLRRRELVKFPVYQGLSLVFLALLAAYVFFRVVADTINSYFGKFLQTGENLCRLPFFDLVAATLLCLALAGLASLAAALRIATIEPGEGLRDE